MGKRFDRQKPIEPIERRLLLSTLYVDAHATGATHDGTSWNSAYLDLQLALAASVSGDEIRVADGTYKPTSGTDRFATFILRDGVKLLGSYAGDGAVDPEARSASSTTILSGDLGVHDDSADNSYHVVICDRVGVLSLLDGFTITGGNAEAVESSGGGIFSTDSSLTISNCIFVQNEAGQGGALYIRGGTPRVINCGFLNNHALRGGGVDSANASALFRECMFSGNTAWTGGAMINEGAAAPELVECLFEENVANSGLGNNGAAIASFGVDSKITNCTFNRNIGGAIGIDYGSPVIKGCVFDSNVISSTSGGNGAAIRNYGEDVVISDCTFTRNQAAGTSEGGAIFNGAWETTIVRCVFTQNAVSGYGRGGAVYNNDGTRVVIDRCSFRANRIGVQGNGGAVYNDSDATVSIMNCAFIANRTGVGGTGGAIYARNSSVCTIYGSTFTQNAAASGSAFFGSTAKAEIVNCIFWANTDSHSEGQAVSSFAPLGAITYNDIETGHAGAGNIAVDPQFVRSPNPGADAAWGTVDDDYGDLSLKATSVCLDVGKNAAVQSGMTTDLAGAPRLADIAGINDFGAVVDMGAYERASQLQYVFDASKPSVTVQFETDMLEASIEPADLQLTIAGNNVPLSILAANVTYDASTRTSTWQFASALPDGDFRATVAAGSVSSLNGAPLAANVTGNLYTLAGDANRDRKVDIADLTILATNWYGSGKLFSQGDFNYDGTVDSIDLGILANRWQKNLVPPIAAAPVSTGMKAAVRKPARMISVVV